MGLFDNVLSSNQTLIKNEAALDYEFLPKTIPYREQEQQYFATCIKPLFAKRSGRNLLIFGPPGVGKTVAVRHVIRELEDETDEVVPLYINCWQSNTSYKVVVEICEQLGYAFTQNKKTTELFKIAIQLLNKNSVVLVFDEIDKAEDFDFLYTLVEDVYHKAIFLLTNYKSWLISLDERIRSRLTPELQEFRAYNGSETTGILKERIDYAFYEGVWEDGAFALVAEKTSQLKDIRSGLFLLKESALLAEEKSQKKILPEHVQTAMKKLDDFTIKNSTQLTDDEQFIFKIVKEHSGKKIGDLFTEYEKMGGKASYKTFQRKIAKLEEGKFIHVTKKTGAGGNTTIVEKKLTDF
ncbi:AAA family ATPase [Candidatus Woesearchaeota archaeon]|nr:AAA family ATPase [Candidatus Woesearchaeota archaeon]